MKPIVVRNQVKLGMARCLFLTIAGMYYRLTRSVITVSIVALAVAFLTYVATYSFIVQTRVTFANGQLNQVRLFGEWAGRLTIPDHDISVIESMAKRRPDRMTEYRRWGAFSGEEFEHALIAMGRFSEFVIFFDYLQPSSRAILLGDIDAYDLPRHLYTEDNFAIFMKQLKELSLRPPLGNEDSLRMFIVRHHPDIRAFINRVNGGHLSAIRQVRNGMGGEDVLDAFMDDPGRLGTVAADAGFSTGSQVFVGLAEQARLERNLRLVNKRLTNQDVSVALERVAGMKREHINMAGISRWLSSPARAKLLVECLNAGGEAENVPSAAELAALAEQVRRTTRLQRIIESSDEGIRTFMGLPQETLWLILVSFLVCAVGICNTMFMSVTERFSEIATMKCLGAMDGTIMLMFVFESAIMGIAGSILGIVLGIMLTALRGVISYGSLFFEQMPVKMIGNVSGVALVSGVLLAAVAAVGPAWMASRLAPMEAMRVE